MSEVAWTLGSMVRTPPLALVLPDQSAHRCCRRAADADSAAAGTQVAVVGASERVTVPGQFGLMPPECYGALDLSGAC